MKDAVAVVVKKGGRFLLIKRAKKNEAEDYWCPITGAVEQGETQEEAVVREAKEEMNIVVHPIKKVWECLTDDKRYLLHWWYVESTAEGIVPNPGEVKEYSWFTWEEMQKIDKMFDADLHFFREIGARLTDPEIL